MSQRTRELLDPVQAAVACLLDSRRVEPQAVALPDSPAFESDVRPLRIVLNTMPKVGSNSILALLVHALPKVRIEPFHGITLETQRTLTRVIDAANNDWGRRTTNTHVLRMMAVRPEIEHLCNSQPLDTGLHFICGTREPIGWALSTLFQLQDVGVLPDSVLRPTEARRLIMDWMQGRPPCAFFPRPEDWFELEVNHYLGKDPMKLEFDIMRGFQVYSTQRGPLLVIRNENLRNLPQALSELLAVPQHVFQYELPRANVTEEKQQGMLYREVAAILRFPASFVEEVYAQPYSTTFYSAEERRVLTTKWSE